MEGGGNGNSATPNEAAAECYNEWNSIEVWRMLGRGVSAITYLVHHRNPHWCSSSRQQQQQNSSPDSENGARVSPSALSPVPNQFAAKLMPRENLQEDVVAREVLIHRQLVHPTIVAFERCILTPTHLCILMEYAAGGELFRVINEVGRLSDDGALYFFKQLLAGVKYLHSAGVVHRDLKLENTLLDNSTPPRVKITDFGLSKDYYASSPKTAIGTPMYMAPEILKHRHQDSSKSAPLYDGRAADVYSLGVLLFVMLYGQYPFPQNRTVSEQISAALEGNISFPDKISIRAEAKSLIQGMLSPQPSDRLTVDQVKEHEWVKRTLPPKYAYGDTIIARTWQSDDILHTYHDSEQQPSEEIRRVIKQASQPPPISEGNEESDDDDDSYDVSSDDDISEGSEDEANHNEYRYSHRR